jgi:hypothetical protein
MPSGAHLLELPNKRALPAQEYLVVQQLYRGWAWVGIIVVGEFVSTATLTAALWHSGHGYGPALLAVFCVIGTQISFWLYAQPANRVTKNWTVLPTDWERLRRQWEYSHAVSALLTLLALLALTWLAVVRDSP